MQLDFPLQNLTDLTFIWTLLHLLSTNQVKKLGGENEVLLHRLRSKRNHVRELGPEASGPNSFGFPAADMFSSDKQLVCSESKPADAGAQVIRLLLPAAASPAESPPESFKGSDYSRTSCGGSPAQL